MLRLNFVRSGGIVALAEDSVNKYKLVPYHVKKEADKLLRKALGSTDAHVEETAASLNLKICLISTTTHQPSNCATPATNMSEGPSSGSGFSESATTRSNVLSFGSGLAGRTRSAEQNKVHIQNLLNDLRQEGGNTWFIPNRDSIRADLRIALQADGQDPLLDPEVDKDLLAQVELDKRAENMVPVKSYNLRVTTDAIRGWGTDIREFYVPEFSMAINTSDDMGRNGLKLNVIRDEGARMKGATDIKDAFMPRTLIENAVYLLKLKGQTEGLGQRILPFMHAASLSQ